MSSLKPAAARLTGSPASLVVTGYAAAEPTGLTSPHSCCQCWRIWRDREPLSPTNTAIVVNP